MRVDKKCTLADLHDSCDALFCLTAHDIFIFDLLFYST